VGAVHFSEVIYVFNNLRMKDYPWTEFGPEGRRHARYLLDQLRQAGNRNGPALSNWPVCSHKDEFRHAETRGALPPGFHRLAAIDEDNGINGAKGRDQRPEFDRMLESR